jgi:Transglutaminase-like superfamily
VAPASRIGFSSDATPLPCSGVFFLQSHIYLCQSQRHWVILDVRRDKYLCVDRFQLESLGPWIEGWEGRPARRADGAGKPAPSALALASSLLSVGILSEHPDGAKQARATMYAHPTSALDSSITASSRMFRCTHALPFWLGCAAASKQLRTERFESIVARVQARKRAASHPMRLEAALPLLAVFDRLRLFYPRPYLCLFDSLALIHFLARFDLYPDWVFAVRADPFEAHCWVQADAVVLNDTVERVASLHPIMVI